MKKTISLPGKLEEMVKDPKNLWPEPHKEKKNSLDKDKIENWLHRQVCSGTMAAKEAQSGIATDWRQDLPRVRSAGTKVIEKPN